MPAGINLDCSLVKLIIAKAFFIAKKKKKKGIIHCNYKNLSLELFFTTTVKPATQTILKIK